MAARLVEEFGEPDGRELRVVAAEEGGELVGLVPLALRRGTHCSAIPVRRIELVGSGEDEADEIASDYVGGLAADGRQEDGGGRRGLDDRHGRRLADTRPRRDPYAHLFCVSRGELGEVSDAAVAVVLANQFSTLGVGKFYI